MCIKEAALGLEVNPTRPIARLIVEAIEGRASMSSWRVGPYAPPPTGDRSADTPAWDEETAADLVARSGRLLQTVLGGRPATDISVDVWPDVVVWSPNCYTSTRDELIDVLYERAFAGETLTEVAVDIVTRGVFAPHIFLEWHLTGRFTEPCFVDDRLLLEPTGRRVQTAGAAVLRVVGDSIASVHCYWDDVALLEQLIGPA